MKVNSVQQPDQPTTITTKDTTPISTSTGVLIGVYYNPSQEQKTTAEDEFWRAVLLDNPKVYVLSRFDLIVGAVLVMGVICLFASIFTITWTYMP
jgi:hypothetical protein